MRRIDDVLILIDADFPSAKLVNILQDGCAEVGYTFESIPVNDAGDFGAYFKMVIIE